MWRANTKSIWCLLSSREARRRGEEHEVVKQSRATMAEEAVAMVRPLQAEAFGRRIMAEIIGELLAVDPMRLEVAVLVNI